jgi:hypothetical protein
LIDKGHRRLIDRTKSGKARMSTWLNRALLHNPFMSASADLWSLCGQAAAFDIELHAAKDLRPALAAESPVVKH